MTWQKTAGDLSVLEPTEAPSELESFRFPWGEPPAKESEPAACNTGTSYVRVQFLVVKDIEMTWQQVLGAAHEAGAFEFLAHPDEDVWDGEPNT